MTNALILIAIVLSLTGAGFELWLMRRLQRTEQAVVAVLRLMNTTQALPRELADYLADTPGGVHRG